METLTFSGRINQLKMKLEYTKDDGKVYDITIKEHRNKRSRNANAYMWEIIGKIADVTRADKEQIYLHMLEHYGQGEVMEMRGDIDVAKWFKYHKVIGKVVHDGREWIQFHAYRGSSEYDTREMAILIDGVVNEATNLGIPTIGEAELAKMKGAWGE